MGTGATGRQASTHGRNPGITAGFRASISTQPLIARAPRVEWVGGVTPAADEPQVSDYGPATADSLQEIRWRDWVIRVPPLYLQRAVSARRGMADRVALIDNLG